MGDATTSGRRAQALVSASTAAEPRWTPETRPVVDGAKPASERAAPSASLLPRSIVMEQAPCVGVFGAEEGISRYPRLYTGGQTKELAAGVERALAALQPKEAQVVRRRFGVRVETPQTLNETE